MDELTPDDDPILTPREARRLLGDVPIATWGRWVRRGLIETAHRTLGGHRRFRRSVVLAFRASRPQIAPAGA